MVGRFDVHWRHQVLRSWRSDVKDILDFWTYEIPHRSCLPVTTPRLTLPHWPPSSHQRSDATSKLPTPCSPPPSFTHPLLITPSNNLSFPPPLPGEGGL